MLIKKSNSKKIRNSSKCTVWEYAYPSRKFSFARVLIDERYPEKGMAKNIACEEIYYVMSGSGVIHSGKSGFKVKEGDLYFFKKGETYWVEGNKLLLAAVNAPKWTKKQHKHVN